jgi:hypothetical protein
MTAPVGVAQEGRSRGGGKSRGGIIEQRGSSWW